MKKANSTIQLTCRQCQHMTFVDRSWAATNMQVARDASMATIESLLVKNSQHLKCRECGTHKPFVSRQSTGMTQRSLRPRTRTPIPIPRKAIPRPRKPKTSKAIVAKPVYMPKDHKRYIDEGIAGSREDNKKMASRQRARNIQTKF